MSTSTSEKVLQTHAVAALLRLQLAGLPILFAGDMGGGFRSPAAALWAKATGLTAGEPDLRIYGPAGRVLFVEVKTIRGRLSDAQLARHKALAALGHDVRILRASTGEQAATAITAMVRAWLQEAGSRQMAIAAAQEAAGGQTGPGRSPPPQKRKRQPGGSPRAGKGVVT